jgi:hypothetical protein
VSGTHRANIPQPVPRNTSAALKRFNFTVFYIKTWICPVNTIFNPSTDMCVPCPVSNCLTCFNMTTCLVCNTSAGFFYNATSMLCECNITACVFCASLTTCVDCNETMNYVVLPNNSCQLCQANLNYFADAITNTCVLCTLNECVTCSSLTQCTACNTANAYYVGTGGTCEYCNSTQNYFIQPGTNNCLVCPILNCQLCSSYIACQTCNPGYLPNPTTGQCEICTLVGCITCDTLNHLHRLR